MTIIEALRNSVSNYPLNDANVEPLCIKRGLKGDEELTTEIVNSKAYELATADVYKFLIMSVNLSQSGASVTKSGVEHWVGTANAIYRKYGEPIIGNTADEKPSVTFGYKGEFL